MKFLNLFLGKRLLFAATTISLLSTLSHPLAAPRQVVDASVWEALDSLPFSHPAGCSAPAQSVDERLADIQQQLGDTLTLEQTRQYYIWNGPSHKMMNVTDDKFAFEFVVNQFQPPYTYKADQIATIFINHGFVIWFRMYNRSFGLLAVPVMDGVYQSAWGDYVHAYWEKGGIPNDDRVQLVTKKLPCRWVVEQGFVAEEQLHELFNFDWHIPNYTTAGRKYQGGESCHT